MPLTIMSKGGGGRIPCQAITDGNAWDIALGVNAVLSLDWDTTMTIPANMEDGMNHVLLVEQGGFNTLSFSGDYVFPDGQPVIPADPGSRVIMEFVARDGKMVYISDPLKASKVDLDSVVSNLGGMESRLLPVIEEGNEGMVIAANGDGTGYELVPQEDLSAIENRLLPVIEEGNGGMVVAAKEDLTGYELITPPDGGGGSPGGGDGTGDVESFSSSLMVSVGTGGDYATLNEALTDLSKLHVSFPANYDPVSQGSVSAPTAIIMLMPGYVITEPVICNGIDLSWIYIISMLQMQPDVGSLVTVNADSIRLAKTFTDLTDETVRAVFVAASNGVCPVICFGFTMTGTPGQNDKVGGLAAVDGGKIFMRGSFINDAEACQKIDNCEGVAVFAGSGGYVNVNGWNISGCRGNVSVNAYDCGRINLGWGAVSGATGTSVVASYGGVVSMDTADVSGAGGSYGVRAYAGGKIIMIETNARKGDSESTDDIVVQDGGIIVANLASGGTSQTPNTITADGIIFKEIA